MIAFILLVLVFMPVSKNEPLIGHICGSRGSNNYTANSTYHANLLRLSTTLPKNTSSSQNLFAEGFTGVSPDTVYGLALCRGDANASACSNCIGNAFESAQLVCPSNRDAYVFYDMCQIWFSDLDFIHPSYYYFYSYYDDFFRGTVNTMNTNDTKERKLPGWDPSNATSITQIVQVLLQETSKPAAYVYLTSRYVTGFMDATSINPPLYSMAQCTPDLSSDDCWNCLRHLAEVAMANFTGQQGGRVLSLRCNLRYDTTVFYSGVPIWRIAAPVTSALPPVAMRSSSPERKRRKVLVISVVVALLASIFCFIISYGFIIIRRRKVRASALNENITSNFQVGFIRRQDNGKGSLDKTENKKDEEALVNGLDRRVSEFRVYDFSQVMDATGNFSDRNKLGRGGFGPVYKGRFPDGLEIAVKRLAARSVQGFTEFKNEIELIANLQHTNLVRLLGYCSQGEEKILIYEYLPNKSLDFFIFDPTRKYILSWEKRLAIIEGITQGMLYLHKHSRLRVIHRDLKASNILLDRKMNPKISDFGLAKIFSTNEDTQGNTKRIAGTFGYMAPEYASEGLFSTKSDVFSFGVLLLEIVTGKRVSRFNGYGDFINLLGHAWQLWKDGLWLQLVDASLVTECHTTEMMRCINIALLCAQENAADRPTMTHVLAMLTSESMTLPEPKHPAFFHIRVGNNDVSSAIEQSSSNSVTVSAVGAI